jgi:uncharacterized protein (DUF305 family)
MKQPHTLATRATLAALLLCATVVSCSSGKKSAVQIAPRPAPTTATDASIAKARADSARYPYTQADIHFMSGMIGHHAQAIVMAGWAPTHGASASVRTLSARIINAQQDEIVTMQRWLRNRRLPAPGGEARATGMSSMPPMPDMPGMQHDMLMPGMLTDAQMKELDAARGEEFDRLFLTYMIQHHRGAVTMVQQLFGSEGAAQDEIVFKFANDVNVDQSTEIARMQKMLVAITK